MKNVILIILSICLFSACKNPEHEALKLEIKENVYELEVPNAVIYKKNVYNSEGVFTDKTPFEESLNTLHNDCGLDKESTQSSFNEENYVSVVTSFSQCISGTYQDIVYLVSRRVVQNYHPLDFSLLDEKLTKVVFANNTLTKVRGQSKSLIPENELKLLEDKVDYVSKKILYNLIIPLNDINLDSEFGVDMLNGLFEGLDDINKCARWHDDYEGRTKCEEPRRLSAAKSLSVHRAIFEKNIFDLTQLEKVIRKNESVIDPQLAESIYDFRSVAESYFTFLLNPSGNRITISVQNGSLLKDFKEKWSSLKIKLEMVDLIEPVLSV